MHKIYYVPIGIVHSPFTNPEGTPIQSSSARGTEAIIEIYKEYTEGLKDLDGFSHIYVLYHLHLSGKGSLSVIPFLDTKYHGVFATRSPQRPNPIGISVVELLSINKNLLHVKNMDILDGTPLLDLKPYIPAFDVFATSKNGWVENNLPKLDAIKDDGRFKK
jgi:tRNA-Thr(GGU) m(6)t(6)A37 methyltransferase TsaA